MIYELAGLRVNIKNRCRYTSEFCKEYLSADQLSPAAFEVEVTGEEFAEEKKQSEGFSDGYIENICLYRSIWFADAEIRQIFVTLCRTRIRK